MKLFSLLKEIQSVEFILATVIWYDLLQETNKISKVLQKKDMHMDLAISLLNGLKGFFLHCRVNGFETSLEIAEKIAQDNDIDVQFKEKRICKKKRLFNYEGEDSPISNGKEEFRIKFFFGHR